MIFLSNDELFLGCWKLVISSISTAWNWFTELFPPSAIQILFLFIMIGFIIALLVNRFTLPNPVSGVPSSSVMYESKITSDRSIANQWRGHEKPLYSTEDFWKTV